jgi:hypothetical protein
MRLTVGPLPAAVYWRRRAVVLLAFAMVVLVISYAWGGADSSTASTQPTHSPSHTGTPSATATLLHPTSQSPKPTQTAFTLPTTGVTGGCTDAEMRVTAAAAAATVQRGQPVAVTIKIKNISNRTCVRDIGADVQELRLVDGDIIIWSSDDCSPNKGHDNRSFTAGKEVSFTITWNGRRSRTGTGAVNCAGAAPDGAVYQLVARLDSVLSSPYALRVQT